MMSGLGRVPSFEPDEETKALIESMFSSSKEEKKEESKSKITPGKRHRIRIPDPPVQNKTEEELSVRLAKQEMDTIHDAFMEFSEKTSDTVIYGYLYSEILELVEAFQDMEAMIDNTIDEKKITESGKEWYEKMKKIRARVLHDIYKKYGNSK